MSTARKPSTWAARMRHDLFFSWLQQGKVQIAGADLGVKHFQMVKRGEDATVTCMRALLRGLFVE